MPSQLGCISLIYINNTYLDDVRLPQLENETYCDYISRCYPLCCGIDINLEKYPCMCLIVYNGTNFTNILSTRRNLYNKWQSGDRNPQDYMYVFKYQKEHQTLGNPLKISHKILSFFTDKSSLKSSLAFILFSYLQYYRSVWAPGNVDGLLKSYDLTLNFKSMRKIEPVKEDKSITAPVNTALVEPLKKINLTANYRELYRKNHAANIKESNRRYYLARKERLKLN